MADKILNTRIKNKHDIAKNWNEAINFIPLAGEIVIYDDLNKIKVGDGATSIIDLPFINDNLDNYYTKAEVNNEIKQTIEENTDPKGILTIDGTKYTVSK